MKNLGLILIFFGVSLVIAEDYRKYQPLYRASEGSLLVEGGYIFEEQRYNYTEEFSQNFQVNNGEKPEDKLSFTNSVFNIEYGIFNNFAVGTDLVHTKSSYREGFGDYQFYGSGQLQNFFYELRFFYSPENATRSNNNRNFSGGDHVQLELGYTIGDFGIIIRHTPGFSYKIEYEDSDLVEEEQKLGKYEVSLFYEFLKDDNTFGLLLSHTTDAGIRLNDFKKIENAFTSTAIRFYSAHRIHSFTILPALSYNNLLPDKKYGFGEILPSMSISMLELKARYEF